MKEYELERHNPFTLSFGKKPFEYIGRDEKTAHAGRSC